MCKGERDEVNLDRILVEEVGQWGRYQLRALLLCGLVAVMGGMSAYLYLFTLVKVKTRCVVPECEDSSSLRDLSPAWAPAALPAAAAAGDSFDNCRRFLPTSGTFNSSDTCVADLFDRNSTIECQEFVYEHNNSAYYEFELACDNWRPTLVGSAHLLGMMICLPVAGLVSDRCGRRIVLAFSAISIAGMGTTTYFAGSYISYILLSMAQCLLGGCTFSCAYILAVEYVGPKHRVVTGITMSTFLSIGEILTGLIAWTEPYWRHLILMVFVPQFIFVTYFWIAPESVRWLISKGLYKESLTILKNAAKMNGTTLSERTIKGFSEVREVKKSEKDKSEPWLVCLVFMYKPMLLRCLLTPVWWITSIMLYYGLTIASVGISGNRFLNYTASTAVQIPGYWTAVLLLDRIGRKALVLSGFWISGACQFVYIFVSNEHYWLSLSVYLIGKMSISCVVTSLYVYTAELFPTRHRTSLFAYSSMMGRIGGILAPLMPGLAAEVWVQLPFLIFGVMALVSGLLVLLAPETLGTTLPDTMEEAAQISRETPSGILRCLRTLVFRSKSYNVR